MHKIVNPFPWKDNIQNMSIDWFYEKSTIYGGFRCFFLSFFNFDVLNVVFFMEMGTQFYAFFYFVAYFHHETKSKTGNEIGQKFNFLWFPQKLTLIGSNEKMFKHFGPQS